MVLVPSGTISRPASNKWVETKKDSTLLSYLPKRTLEVDAFLMSDHEVTNWEYRQFIDWVRDSIARTVLAEDYDSSYFLQSSPFLDWSKPFDYNNPQIAEVLSGCYLPQNERFYYRKEWDVRNLFYVYDNQKTNVYPDTTGWTAGAFAVWFEPMRNMYAWHPAYDNCPVLNVNWEQAQAYCHWKTKAVRKRLAKLGAPADCISSYRLPTSTEWEYAACYNSDDSAGNALFPWKGMKIRTKDGSYLANYGRLVDSNGFVEKDWNDDFPPTKAQLKAQKRGPTNSDVHRYAAPIKTYPPNELGLYDLAGNAAEWTQEYFEGKVYKRTFDRQKYTKPFESQCAKMITIPFDLDATLNQILTQLYDSIIGQSPTVNKARESTVLDGAYIKEIDCEADSAAIEGLATQIHHDLQLINKHAESIVVKGGSWDDQQVYLCTDARTLYRKTAHSRKVGFRVAMSISAEALPYFKAR